MDHAKASILCVDDEENAVLMRRLVLERAGYEIVTACSASEALEIMAKRKFDLVLADQAMPRMTGAELAREIKKVHPETPVILFSAIHEAPADTGNADLYMNKMEGPQKLMETIARMLHDRPAGDPAEEPKAG